MRILLLLILCISSQSAYCQDSKPSQKFMKLGDPSLLLGGIALMMFSYEHAEAGGPLSVSEVNALNSDDINPFDRFATRQNSTLAVGISDGLLIGSLVLPSVLLREKLDGKDKWLIALQFAQTMVWTTGITYAVKGTVLRPRPYAYNSAFTMEVRTDREARFSYFSGHASISAAASFFTLAMYKRYGTHKKLTTWVGYTAIAIPTIVSTCRVLGGKHFPTDVISGYLVGAGIGTLLPALHDNKFKTKHRRLTFMPIYSSSYMGIHAQFLLH